MGIVDLPPKLWLPPRPAIIRPGKLQIPELMLGIVPGMSAAVVMGADEVVVPSLVYQGSLMDGTNQSTYTFTSFSIGEADDTRFVLVGFNCSKLTADLSQPNSCTIGGVSASLLVDRNGTAQAQQIWGAVVPTGTTANIVVTRSASMVFGLIHVWSAYDLESTTPIEGLNLSINNPPSGDLDTLAGGIAIGFTGDNTATNGTFSVSGLVEDEEGDGTGTGSSIDWCAASKSPTLAGTLAVTITFSGGGGTGIAASFR